MSGYVTCSLSWKVGTSAEEKRTIPNLQEKSSTFSNNIVAADNSQKAHLLYVEPYKSA